MHKTTISTRSKIAIAVAVFTTLGATATAYAQSAGLEEIIVTATRKSESLQEVGMAITSLGNEEIERMGATNLLDFAVRVPNLSMAYEADGRFDSSSPSIRGVFGKDTTGFYFDETPVNASMLPRVMDIERIEVLRGPQGSLWGAKSMGGTIRMITKKPDLQSSDAQVHTVLSSVKDGDENHNVDGSVNIPIVEDVFAVRINAYAGSNSGVFDDKYQGTWTDSSGGARTNPGPDFGTIENVDDEDYWGGQIAAKWVINENAVLDVRYMMQEVEADGLPFADIDPENTTRNRFFNAPEPGTDEWSIASATLSMDVSSGTLTSTLSSYQRETDETEEEANFLHFLFDNVIGIPIDPLYSILSTVEDYESTVFESRFSSDLDGSVNFTVGVFYSDKTWDHEYPRSVQTGLAAAIDGLTGAPGLGQDCVDGFCLTDDDLIFVTTTMTDTEEKAIFGEVTWQINETMSLTTGGRWYETSIDAVNTADGFANSGPSSYNESQKETGFNPKVLFQAAISDDLNVYLSGAKGFRTGGVNGNLPPGLCGPELTELGVNPSNATTYESDDLWSYELGFKSSLADNRITLNAAVFMVDWQDVQQLNRLACGFQFTQNAGEAESRGFEVELVAMPTEGLMISAAVGYTDATITNAGGVSGVKNGDKVQGVADLTATLSAQYIWQAFGPWNGIVRADGNYYGDSYSGNNESSSASQRLRPSWNALNLRAGIIDDNWEIMAFIENATDERANLADSRSIAAETPERARLVTNRPRTVGMDVRYKF
jgi:iron complex outermembrane receptor protein